MKRVREIREKEREIREGKRYDFHQWIKDFIIPADKRGWNWLLISGGDVRDKMQLDFSDLTRSRCKVVEIDSVPHTVIELRDRFIPVLERSKNLRGFYSILSHKIAEADLKRYHYDLWRAAHNLEAKVERLGELQRRDIRRTTETEREVFAHNTIRDAARHNRDF